MEERKERRKEGTYVKRAIWWRDKISYGGLLHLSSKLPFAAIFSFILVIPKHHLLVREVQYHKFCLKCLCLREKTKVKKVKSDKKRIVCGFHFKEHHFKRESDCETLRISGRFETKG